LIGQPTTKVDPLSLFDHSLEECVEGVTLENEMGKKGRGDSKFDTVAGYQTRTKQ
jgi:hypothetical protein